MADTSSPRGRRRDVRSTMRAHLEGPGLDVTSASNVAEAQKLITSIFRTLKNNLETIDFSMVLLGVMTIADDVDSQLSQCMRSDLETTKAEALSA